MLRHVLQIHSEDVLHTFCGDGRGRQAADVDLALLLLVHGRGLVPVPPPLPSRLRERHDVVPQEGRGRGLRSLRGTRHGIGAR